MPWPELMKHISQNGKLKSCKLVAYLAGGRLNVAIGLLLQSLH